MSPERARNRLTVDRIQQFIRAGVIFRDPRSVEIGEQVRIESGAVIDANVLLHGDTYISGSAYIATGCQIFNCAIEDQVVVGMCSKILESRICSETSIDGFVEIRHSTIGCKCKLASFTSIHRCQMDGGVKVGSHCDIRDARVGSQTYLAAGVLTPNYDGAAKHRSDIGSNAFVGAGAILVAPISIGEGASVGAGSTLTKDVPPGILGFARAKQVAVTGWRRPTRLSQSHRELGQASTTENDLLTVGSSSAVEKLREMVEQNLVEEQYHKFLAAQYWFFGSHYEHCYSKERLGAKFIVDLLLERFDGQYDVVELKTPSDKLFATKRGRMVPSQFLQNSITQTQDYLDFARTHRISETFDRGIDFRIRKGRIVIGRTIDSEREALRNLNDRHVGVEIVTYDDLIRIGVRHLKSVEKLQGPAKPDAD